jgi:serine/threonine protein kinase
VLLPGERSADPYGTLAYCSPEIIAKKPHTTKTDVWSLGIVLYTMLTRRMPFIANDEEQTKNNILYRNLNFDQPQWYGVSPDAKDLLIKMLHKDQRLRYSCEQVLGHPWLSDHYRGGGGGSSKDAHLS